LCRAAFLTPAARRSGVEGAKPPAFLTSQRRPQYHHHRPQPALTALPGQQSCSFQ
jgi:hypothetical protein